MAERKRNRNVQTLEARDGFRISTRQLVHVVADDRLRVIADSAILSRVCGPPILFAIARDSRTIFASWNIDWPSVFEKALPADRQVHLRVCRADGLEEKGAAVEPMAAMHYVTISGPHGSCRVEIGYYQPAGVWHSVAISNEVVMPPNGIAETTGVDLATIPLHVSFQQLLNLFGPATDTELAAVISQFEKRALSSEEKTLNGGDKKILRELHCSVSVMAAAWRAFNEVDIEKLTRRTAALLEFGSTSPARGFEGDWASGGS
jgi:hypothetical protein